MVTPTRGECRLFVKTIYQTTSPDTELLSKFGSKVQDQTGYELRLKLRMQLNGRMPIGGMRRQCESRLQSQVK